MKISEDEARRFLESLLPMQEAEQQLLCPRCGRHELYTGKHSFLNPLSRYAHVHICERCWMDEALREIDNDPVPLTIWRRPHRLYRLEISTMAGRLCLAQSASHNFYEVLRI